jgi:outer membrane protein
MTQRILYDSHLRGILMMTSKRLLLAVMGVAALSATSAMAADLGGSYKDAPSREYVADYGPGWMIRGRILGVIPDEDSTVLPNIGIDNSIVPELDVTYFFNKNLAVEVIAGVTPHTVKNAGAEVGDVWLLPPTVTLQYHFDLGGGIKPYVGAGVNYTVFFNEDAKGGTYTSLDLKNNWGWALQAGVDVHLQGNWFLNVDVKKLFLDSDATVVAGGNTIHANVDIDPWIVGVGLGYRFGGRPEALK